MKEKRLKELLLNDEELLQEVVQELNAWNGSLDWLDYQSNDEDFLNNYFKTPDDAVRAVYFGSYNYNDNYVRFNAYGNLESCTEYDMIEEMKTYIDDIVDNLINEYQNLNLSTDEIDEIMDEEESEEN